MLFPGLTDDVILSERTNSVDQRTPAITGGQHEKQAQPCRCNEHDFQGTGIQNPSLTI
jgi:hypothetical protein